MPTFDWFENESNLKPWTFKLSKESWNFQTVNGKRFGGYKELGELFRMYSEDPKHCFFGCEIFSNFHFLKYEYSVTIFYLFLGIIKNSKKQFVKFSPHLDSDFRLVTFWKIVLLLFV